MKLHEYQSKQIFAKYGIPIPKGRVATTASEAKAIAEELGGRVVIKSQVLVGGRGKAGGVKLAKDPEEAEQLATQILAMEIKGLPVRKVLVDEAAAIESEIYFSITNDRAARKPVMIASAAGGMEIEEVAAKTPEKIIKLHIDPLLGLRDYQARDIAASIDLPRDYWKDFGKIAMGLWRTYCETDASLAEINPLVITKDKRMIALDGKMIIDDNAMFRHADLAEMRDLDEEVPAETEARKYGLTYIKLDGNIGCMVNGAGLAMTTAPGGAVRVRLAALLAGQLVRGGSGWPDTTDQRRSHRVGGFARTEVAAVSTGPGCALWKRVAVNLTGRPLVTAGNCREEDYEDRLPAARIEGSHRN